MAKKKIAKRSRISDFLISSAVLTFVFSIFVFLFLIHDMPDLERLESKGRRASVVFESYDGANIATYGDLFKELLLSILCLHTSAKP